MLKNIYGPVSSWRLGKSLGIDILSGQDKICNFNCVYCQIGETSRFCTQRQVFVDSNAIIKELEPLNDINIDYITLSGRGEPTLAENISDIITKIKNIRGEKLAVITNSTLLHDKNLRHDISSADVIMAKFDVPSDECLNKINKPANNITFDMILSGLLELRKEFKKDLRLQVMFTKDNYKVYKEMIGKVIDISPDEVQINTPLRPCKVKPLDKDIILNIKKDFDFLDKEYGIRVKSVYDSHVLKVEPINKKDTLKRRGTWQ